jgi:hypothetical protein
MFKRFLVTAGLLFIAVTAMASQSKLDLTALWDFDQPAATEQRLRAKLAGASSDDALILHTQIARTHGMRKDFATAQSILKAIANDIPSASAEARTRYALELGRTYASATHPRASQTPEAKAQARAAFDSALATAKVAQLDALAIDAIHMLAFLDTAPSDQLKWAQQALAVVEGSAQLDAKKWEPSIRNNIGYALHQLARYDEALVQFKLSVALREAVTGANAAKQLRVAHWMVAWTLRALGRPDEAIAIQLRLERESDAAQAPDRYVYEELEALYRAQGNAARAAHYAALRAALVK